MHYSCDVVHATHLQGLLLGDPLFCSFTRLMRVAESMLNFYTSPGKGSPILVLNQALTFIYLSLLIITCYFWCSFFFFLNDCFIYNVKLFLIFVNIDNNVIAQLLWEKRFKMKPIERLDEQDRFQVFQFILAYILRMVCYINMSPRKNYM